MTASGSTRERYQGICRLTVSACVADMRRRHGGNLRGRDGLVILLPCTRLVHESGTSLPTSLASRLLRRLLGRHLRPHDPRQSPVEVLCILALGFSTGGPPNRDLGLGGHVSVWAGGPWPTAGFMGSSSRGGSSIGTYFGQGLAVGPYSRYS